MTAIVLPIGTPANSLAGRLVRADLDSVGSLEGVEKVDLDFGLGGGCTRRFELALLDKPWPVDESGTFATSGSQSHG